MSELTNISDTSAWLDKMVARLGQKMPYAIAQAQGLDGIPYSARAGE